MQTITNNSAAMQGVHTVRGVVFIRPGQSRTVELTEPGLKFAKRLAFLSVSDHAEQEVKTGVMINDDVTDRSELKAQADELGLTYAKNIPTEKLKELIDAKLGD